MNYIEQFDIEIMENLRFYFTKGSVDYKNDCIGFHQDIYIETKKEIEKLTRILNEFIKLTNICADYYSNSITQCYLLSSLFCLANSKYNLNQGTFKYSKKNFITHG